MTTLIDTIQPPESYLETILTEAIGTKTEKEYVAFYLTNLITRLKAEPRLYRSFGAWWPSMKSLIIEQGEQAFSVLIDVDVATIYTMSRPALIVVAAHLYSNERFENGAIYSACHTLNVNDESDDTEPYQWFSNDEDMEMMIQLRGRS
ncbi:olxA [Xenorhabdus bovienii]|uniref:olxA n=1 Tax=Xenorhabdus bovienii TaxID=40576 RepID=UPI001EDFC05E|nr:olxA [Xenorhabdus bovienii]MCG3462209.1 olxA [Xenorhabdus bovienii]